MKRGFLSKTEKEYIEQNQNLSVAELANDLDRTESVVQNYLNLIVPQEEQAKPKTLFEKVIAKKSGATVMTNSASEVVDTVRKGKRLSPKLNNCIHKIK